MPVVATFDGVARRIVLDASVANSEWTPLELFVEYLEERRDNEQFRGFESLVRMVGGEPKGGGKSAPRFLQLLTDRRGITTKLVLPNLGPYRTLVNGELATDLPDTDPEPFDLSNITTAVVIDYKPPDTEIVEVATGGALTPAQAAYLLELWQHAGHDAANPVTETPDDVSFGGITLDRTGDGENTLTTTRANP